MKDIKPAVLFVDDEDRILRAVRRQLGHKFRIHTACGAESGFSALRRLEDVAVVVVDYRMPGMNGLEFMAAGRHIRPKALWIMLSGYATEDVPLQPEDEQPVFSFLSKPCPTEQLEQEISAAVQQFCFADEISDSCQ